MEIQICNENDFIKLLLTNKLDDGNNFEFNLNLKSQNFAVENKIIFASKHELEEFFNQLKNCYENLDGEVVSEFDYNEDITLKLSFQKNGNVEVFCDVFNYGEYTCKCHVEFKTDQTFVLKTLKDFSSLLN